jgi:thiol-disulfide isomerase/thioredoxin
MEGQKMRLVVRFLAATFVVMAFGSPVPAQVYEFTADYCSACRTVEPVVTALIRQGYPIKPVDVQIEPSLARQYGVEKIPCFVAVRDGQVVGRVVGSTGREQLVRLCELTRTAPAATAAADEPIVSNQAAQPPGDRALAQGRQATPPQGTNGPPNTAVEVARAATVLLSVEDATGHSFGTGTIIDLHRDEALVLTCGHIFRSSEGKGKITCELFCLGADSPIEGKLVSYDMRRDVGLVSIRPGVPVTPVLIGGAGLRARLGDPVFSLGCDRGNAPSTIQNKILGVNRYHGPANLVVGGRPVDGRSGGGLFTADGKLIGVCNAADQENNEGLYAALGPIHAELDRSGLGFIYSPQEPVLAGNLGVKPRTTIDGLTVPTTVTDVSALGRVTAVATAQLTPVSLLPGTTPEGGGRDTELICVVRDANDVQGRSRVFVIDRPSSGLVRQISEEFNRRGPHALTQLHQPRGTYVSASDATDGWRSLVGQE